MEKKKERLLVNSLGEQLDTNRIFKIGEIVIVFLAATLLLYFLKPLTKNDPLWNQILVWCANILMLLLVWGGLKFRKETASHFGLTFKAVSLKEAIRVFLLSLLVFTLAVAGFLLGSIVMANITGIPESADMSGYNYLKDNLGMLFLALAGIYIVSSFGEEFIYRGFLINRISEIGGSTKTARIIAVILSSVIFGLIHFAWGPMGMVQTGFMGLALGICYLIFKKRLWILIFAHAYMDTILMVQMYMGSN